jgi:hypothetical protein
MPQRRLSLEDARRLAQHADRIAAAQAQVALANSQAQAAAARGNRALAQWKALAAKYGADVEPYGVELDETLETFGVVVDTRTGQPADFVEAPELPKPPPLPASSAAPSDAPEVIVETPAT